MKKAEIDHRQAIPNKLYFRIGEVSDIVGVKPYVLRYWESEFPDVKPSKSKSGQRLYKRKDVEMLLKIKELLYLEKFTINGARKRLKEPLYRDEAVVLEKGAVVVEEAPALAAAVSEKTTPVPQAPPAMQRQREIPAPFEKLNAAEPALSPPKKEGGLDEKRKTLIKVRRDLESLLKVVQTKALQHNLS